MSKKPAWLTKPTSRRRPGVWDQDVMDMFAIAGEHGVLHLSAAHFRAYLEAEQKIKVSYSAAYSAMHGMMQRKLLQRTSVGFATYRK